jgi:hypothetical protein
MQQLDHSTILLLLMMMVITVMMGTMASGHLV